MRGLGLRGVGIIFLIGHRLGYPGAVRRRCPATGANDDLWSKGVFREHIESTPWMSYPVRSGNLDPSKGILPRASRSYWSARRP